LAETLKTNNTLTAINLSGNKIGSEGTRALAEALKTNTTLTSINLEINQIGTEGTRALAEALKTNNTLTSIDLRYNQIGPEGTQALAEALKTNTTLTSIYLSHNQIGPEDAQALAEALKTNTTLTSIGLNNNQIGDEGAQALAKALKFNTMLTSIELYNNQIGDEGTQALAEALKFNTTLTSISLYTNLMSGNPISDDDGDGDEGNEALQHINTFCKRNKALTQAVELYALFLACFPTEAQDAYLHLKEVTTSSTQRPIVRFFQMAGKLPDDVLQGLAYHVYDQSRDFIPSQAKASAANKFLKQLREEDSMSHKMKAKSDIPHQNFILKKFLNSICYIF